MRRSTRTTQTLVANVHPAGLGEPDAGRPLQPRRDRRRHRRADHRGGRRGARREGRAGRAPPAGRRLPERRLRAVEGVIRSSRVVGEARRRGSARRPRAAGRAAPTSARRWSACAASARGISHDDSAARYRDELGVDVFLGDGALRRAATPSRSTARALRFKKAVIATGRARARAADRRARRGRLPHQRDGLRAHRAPAPARRDRRRARSAASWRRRSAGSARR